MKISELQVNYILSLIDHDPELYRPMERYTRTQLRAKLQDRLNKYQAMDLINTIKEENIEHALMTLNNI